MTPDGDKKRWSGPTCLKGKKVITIWSVMSMHNQYFMCESEIYVGFPDTCSVGNHCTSSEKLSEGLL